MEQTADVILEMFPDVELAVAEGEPELATVFFNLVKVCAPYYHCLLSGIPAPYYQYLPSKVQ